MVFSPRGKSFLIICVLSPFLYFSSQAKIQSLKHANHQLQAQVKTSMPREIHAEVLGELKVGKSGHRVKGGMHAGKVLQEREANHAFKENTHVHTANVL